MAKRSGDKMLDKLLAGDPEVIRILKLLGFDYDKALERFEKLADAHPDWDEDKLERISGITAILNFLDRLG